MAHYIKQELIVDSVITSDYKIAFGLDSNNNVYITNDMDDASMVYLLFSPEDWDSIKKFIDQQFKKGI